MSRMDLVLGSSDSLADSEAGIPQSMLAMSSVAKVDMAGTNPIAYAA